MIVCSFMTVPDDSGDCGLCGEKWEHPNHRTVHKQTMPYRPVQQVGYLAVGDRFVRDGREVTVVEIEPGPMSWAGRWLTLEDRRYPAITRRAHYWDDETVRAA